MWDQRHSCQSPICSLFLQLCFLLTSLLCLHSRRRHCCLTEVLKSCWLSLQMQGSQRATEISLVVKPPGIIWFRKASETVFSKWVASKGMIVLFWTEITTPLPRVYATDCEMCIQDSWQNLSLSAYFNHSCDVPPWVKLWKIKSSCATEPGGKDVPENWGMNPLLPACSI